MTLYINSYKITPLDSKTLNKPARHQSQMISPKILSAHPKNFLPPIEQARKPINEKLSKAQKKHASAIDRANHLYREFISQETSARKLNLQKKLAEAKEQVKKQEDKLYALEQALLMPNATEDLPKITTVGYLNDDGSVTEVKQPLLKN